MRATHRLGAAVVALLAAVLLGGCLKLDADFTVSDDDTVDGTFVFGVDEAAPRPHRAGCQQLDRAGAAGHGDRRSDRGHDQRRALRGRRRSWAPRVTFSDVPLDDFNVPGAEGPENALTITHNGDQSEVSGELDFELGRPPGRRGDSRTSRAARQLRARAEHRPHLPGGGDLDERLDRRLHRRLGAVARPSTTSFEATAESTRRLHRSEHQVVGVDPHRHRRPGADRRHRRHRPHDPKQGEVAGGRRRRRRPRRRPTSAGRHLRRRRHRAAATDDLPPESTPLTDAAARHRPRPPRRRLTCRHRRRHRPTPAVPDLPGPGPTGDAVDSGPCPTCRTCRTPPATGVPAATSSVPPAVPPPELKD